MARSNAGSSSGQPSPRKRGSQRQGSGNSRGALPGLSDQAADSPAAIAAQAAVNAFGPAAEAVQSFLSDLGKAISDGLDTARSEVKTIVDGMGSAIAMQQTPAIVSSMGLQQGMQSAIRNNLATAAEYGSVACNTPIVLSDYQGYPISGTYGSPHSPETGVPTGYPPGGFPATPAPGSPLTLPASPGSSPNGAPILPGGGSSTPGSVPPGPGTSPIGPAPWGQANTAGLAASITPGASAPGGVSGATASNAAGPGGTGGTVTSFINSPPPGWVRCPDTVPLAEGADASFCMGIVDPQEQAKCMESQGFWCPVPTTGTPSPTTPTSPTSPTGPPITTPSPTVGPPPPTPPPPITFKPIPPPTPTPTPVCPPGSTWIPDPNSLGSGECQGQISPTPTPPPIGTPTPTPPPEPPPIGTPAPSSKPCGLTPDNPCFVASNPLDEKYPSLYISSGFGQYLNDNGGDPSVQIANGVNLPVQGQFQDLSSNIQNCSLPYQFSLIPDGQNFHDYFAQFVDTKSVFDQAQQTKNEAEKAGWNPISYFFFGLLAVLISMIGLIIDQIMRGLLFLPQGMLAVVQSNIIFKVFNFFTWGSMSKPGRVKDYADNLSYPVGLPTASEAASAWLSNAIDDCTFETYVKANDTVFVPYKQVALSGKMKFSPIELMTLSMRGAMQRGTIEDRLKEQGSKEVADVAELRALFQQVPGPADLIRFMQRDVENPNVINTFDLDDGFTTNFQGLTQQWATYQGVSADIMLREWRAHWDIPSPTQLYEFNRRLRHDPDFGGVAKVQSDVTTALTQQDIPKYWQKYLLAVSYHPLTRTDLNRAYERGWIQDQDYIDGMYQNGYSDDDAQQLLKFVQQERLLAIRHADFFRAYVDGYVSNQQFSDMMTTEGYDQSLVQDALDEAGFYRGIEQQKLQIQALMRQYKACRITDQELQDDADALGIADDLVTWWKNVVSYNTTCGTRKEFAANLCQAFSEGLVDSTEYIARMKLMKYDDAAIETLLALCENKKAAAQARQQLKQQKQQATQQKQAQKAEQQAERQAEQLANRMARLATANERRRQTRNDQLMAATSKLGQYLSDVQGPPSTLVAGLFSQLQTQNGLSQDEAAKVIATTATAAKGMKSQEYIAWVMQDALVALNEPWQLFPGGIPQVGTPS